MDSSSTHRSQKRPQVCLERTYFERVVHFPENKKKNVWSTNALFLSYEQKGLSWRKFCFVLCLVYIYCEWLLNMFVFVFLVSELLQMNCLLEKKTKIMKQESGFQHVGRHLTTPTGQISNMLEYTSIHLWQKNSNLLETIRAQVPICWKIHSNVRPS